LIYLCTQIRRRDINKEKDLLAIILLSLLSIPVVLLTDGILRIVIGLPLLLFFPGYTLIAALFPGKESIEWIERLALSLGMSIAVVPLIGLVLNYTPWGIRLNPVMIAIIAFILLMCGIAWYRRKDLPESDRFRVSFQVRRFIWKRQTRFDKFLSVVLVLAIVGVIGTVGYLATHPKVGERFTEFYILGAEGKAVGYSTELKLGDRGELILGIVNHEQEKTSYRVEIMVDGIENSVYTWIGDEIITREEKGEGTEGETVEVVLWEEKRQGEGKLLTDNVLYIRPLEHEEKWEGRIFYEPQQMGSEQRLEFLLFYPKLRQGHALSTLLEDDGFARIVVDEAEGEAEISLDNKAEVSRNYRLEVWQQGAVQKEIDISVNAGEQFKDEVYFPAGESVFLLYEDDELVLEDSGAELSLHLWLTVGWS
jgi:uncharacterized membrane protein